MNQTTVEMRMNQTTLVLELRDTLKTKILFKN